MLHLECVAMIDFAVEDEQDCAYTAAQCFGNGTSTAQYQYIASSWASAI